MTTKECATWLAKQCRAGLFSKNMVENQVFNSIVYVARSPLVIRSEIANLFKDLTIDCDASLVERYRAAIMKECD
jgi:hypothetical protein